MNQKRNSLREKINSLEEENDELKVEIDLEGELISALDDLRKVRKKNEMIL